MPSSTRRRSPPDLARPSRMAAHFESTARKTRPFCRKTKPEGSRNEPASLEGPGTGSMAGSDLAVFILRPRRGRLWLPATEAPHDAPDRFAEEGHGAGGGRHHGLDEEGPGHRVDVSKRHPPGHLPQSSAQVRGGPVTKDDARAPNRQ